MSPPTENLNSILSISCSGIFELVLSPPLQNIILSSGYSFFRNLKAFLQLPNSSSSKPITSSTKTKDSKITFLSLKGRKYLPFFSISQLSLLSATKFFAYFFCFFYVFDMTTMNRIKATTYN